ncbi:hypothetical protein [Halorarius litoreus]|uniref:hypothetical protein n=1 Tax=Halorarius litoreus TaxID=2962676 RepID=UPI0020CEF997|nr:hypothetical protein [Halorarius litoreus]
MNPRTLALAGLLLLVVPLVVALFGWLWLPLGLLLLVVGGTLWLVNRYYLAPRTAPEP